MIEQPTEQPSLESSFAAYVVQHTPALMRYALTKCATREEAEDCVAETFLKIWKVWPEKHEEITASGISYAMVVLKNTITDRARYQSRRPKECDLEPRHETTVPNTVDIEATYLFGEFQRELWAAVATLPEVQQQLVHLIYVEGYKVAGAGRVLGLTSSTADRYHRIALAGLKNLLAGPE